MSRSTASTHSLISALAGPPADTTAQHHQPKRDGRQQLCPRSVSPAAHLVDQRLQVRLDKHQGAGLHVGCHRVCAAGGRAQAGGGEVRGATPCHGAGWRKRRVCASSTLAAQHPQRPPLAAVDPACLSQQGTRWPCAPALSTTTGRPRESTPSMYSRPAQGWQWAGRLGACTAAKRRSVPTASVCLLPDTQGAATSGSQALGQQHPPPHTHAPLNVWYHCGGNSSSGCAAASPPSPAGALVAAALMAASALAVS